MESLPGKGTTFTLYFPVLAQVRATVTGAGSSAEAKHNDTILIVDDEIVIREALHEWLSDFGYTVYSADNGDDALRVFEENQASIDLVITDLGMPGMSGEELYRNLVKIDGNVKVMVSSGYLEQSTADALLQMGIKKLLAKPYKMAEIQSAIHSIIS